jgi:hypothetical protein
MNGKLAHFKDQYGYWYVASSLKELKSKYKLTGKVDKMYIVDEGKTYHIGYVIGKLWLNVYFPLRTPV